MMVRDIYEEGENLESCKVYRANHRAEYGHSNDQGTYRNQEENQDQLVLLNCACLEIFNEVLAGLSQRHHEIIEYVISYEKDILL